MLDALTAAHRAGVLHRDVKPHNVLIGPDGRVVLTDFGLATFVDDGSVTGPGLVVGSPQYVSPERARDGASTVESDLWSLGATLYAAVEGRSPYARESAMATLMALATEPPDPAELAGPLAPVLTGLLQHEPADRLTAEQVEEQLRAIVGTARAAMPAPPGPARLVRPAAPGPVALGRGPTEAPPGSREPRPDSTASSPACRSRALSAELRSRPIQPARSRPALEPSGPASEPSLLGVRRCAPVRSRRSADPPAQARRRPGRPGAAGPARRRWHRLSDAARRPDAAVGRPDRRRQPGDIRQRPGPPRSAASARPSATASPRPTRRGPRSPAPSAPAGDWTLVSGFSYFTDTSGFDVGVPDGWKYERVGTTVCFWDPGNIRILSIDSGRNPKGDPVKACQAEAKRLVEAGALPGLRPDRHRPRAAGHQGRGLGVPLRRRGRRPDAREHPLVRLRTARRSRWAG